jgi:phage terminase small subunit
MLTAKQKRFVQEYALDPNAAAAARRAGYSPNGAKVTGCRLLTNPNLKAALAAKQAENAEHRPPARRHYRGHPRWSSSGAVALRSG